MAGATAWKLSELCRNIAFLSKQLLKVDPIRFDDNIGLDEVQLFLDIDVDGSRQLLKVDPIRFDDNICRDEFRLHLDIDVDGSR